MVNHFVSFIGILLFFTKCGTACICDEKVSIHFLYAAVDLIGKAKQHFNPRENNPSQNALDCSDLLEMGHKKNDVYKIWPQNRIMDGKPLEVYCDMTTDGGGWTVIQRRGSFGRAVDYFYKDWKSYKEGFGDLEKELWLGNDNIFVLTNQRRYSVRFDLESMSNDTRFAHYDKFWIDDESNRYTLHIRDYRGDAGDSMRKHDGQKFSATDVDEVTADGKCVEKYRGGWWYYGCHEVNLNGLNLKGKHESFANGINWKSWTGYKESLQSTEIKIRPRNFKLPKVSIDETPLR